ncbi:MAG: segregation and condensation protein B [Bacteroidia bacterium]|nr:MAG: segregation and condensation protein B [Bacteroidia bacterium]
MEEGLGSYPLENLIEAILFVHPEPLPERRLQQAVSAILGREVTAEEVQTAIGALQVRYAFTSLEVQAVAEGYAFRTRPEYGAAIAKFLGLQQPIRLSKALLETLAVIAYHQPVTKAFVSHLRGTQSDYAVEKLLELELIEPAGRADLPGKPLMYRTTPKFLELVGLRSLADLPRVEELGAGEGA